MRRVTLAVKLGLWMGTLAMLMAVLSGGVTTLLTAWETENQIREEMITQAHDLVREELVSKDGGIHLQREDEGTSLAQTLRENNLSMLLTDAEGREVARYGIYRNLTGNELEQFLPAELTAQGEGKYRDVVSKEHGLYDTYTLPLVSTQGLVGYMQVAKANEFLPNLFGAFWRTLLSLTPLIWLVSLLAAGAASRVVLRPLRALVEYMEKVRIEGIEKEVSVSGRLSPEVATLAETFNKLLGKMREALLRERESAENISHEIKTPLTRIAAGIDAMARKLSGEQAGRARELEVQVVELGRSVDTILLLSTPKEEKDESWLPGLVLGKLKREMEEGGRVRLRVECKGKLKGSRAHVEVLLRNLLDNAVKHGKKEEEIVVAAAGQSTDWEVAMTNTMTRPVKVSKQLLKRHSRQGVAGYGLGLSIAQAVCRKQGWEMSLEQPEEKMFRVRVRGGKRGLL